MQDIQEKSTRTKICFLITKGVWGGAQKYVFTLATSLSKNDYDVLVLCGEGEILPEKLSSAGIRIIRLSEMKRDISIVSEIKNFFSIFKILKNERPDILHLNSPKASGLGALAGRLFGVKKIIFTAHGWTFNENRGAISKKTIKFLSWLTVILCHQTIVINDKEKRQAVAWPFVSNKIKLIRNGIDSIDFQQKTTAREKLCSIINKNVTDGITWIGTISELHKNKGLEYAVSAISRITFPFVFFIIGEGEERKNLENLIKQSGLEDKVFLVGFIDNANQYLKAFDIFMLTSIKEGLPYTILEAGLAGLPVIASSVGGIPDIINNEINGTLVEKTDTEQIMMAINHLISNPKERTDFGTRLQEKIEKEFSLEQMLKKTLEIYNS